MKAAFGHQREQLVAMTSIETEFSGHFEKVHAGGWVQRDVFDDSYHSWHTCGVLDLMTAESSTGAEGGAKNFSASDFLSHRKTDLLNWLLLSFGRPGCLQSRKKHFLLLSRLLGFGLWFVNSSQSWHLFPRCFLSKANFCTAIHFLIFWILCYA